MSTSEADRVEKGIPVANDGPAPPKVRGKSYCTNGSDSSSRGNGSSNVKSRLSTVSRMYDIDGDGKLDEAEQAMRDMDKTGRGYLTNEKIHDLMTEHLDTQRELFKVKKIVIGLAIFAVILGLSNLGTSLAAAYLAKDTKTNDSAELVDNESGEVVGTQTVSENYEVSKSSSVRRGLKDGNCDNIGGDYSCALTAYLQIDKDTGKTIIKKCKDGKKVTIERTFAHDDTIVQTQICPPTANNPQYGRKESYAKLFYDTDETVEITSMQGDVYEITGNYLLQDVGHICDVTDDCDLGLSCDSNNECADPTTNKAITPSVSDLQIGEVCDGIDKVCATSLKCYIPETCFAPPCTGTCGCDDDTDCSVSGEICVDDITNQLKVDGYSQGIYAQKCMCDVENQTGCNNPTRPVCMTNLGGNVCGCRDSSDCQTGYSCPVDPTLADVVYSCEVEIPSLPEALQASGNECDAVSNPCAGGLTCYVDICDAEPCPTAGICGCSDDNDCTSPDVCVDDVTNSLGFDVNRVEVFSKTCGCEIGTSNGCDANDPAAPMCVASMGGGVCGCLLNDHCPEGYTCPVDPMLADMVYSCEVEIPSLPEALPALGDECDAVSNPCAGGLTCYVNICDAEPCPTAGTCGCSDDNDCTSPDVCVDDVTNSLGFDVNRVEVFSKTCGCEIGTSNGCDPTSSAPVCVTNMMGSGTCGCVDDSDCSGSDTCGSPWCLSDIISTCGREEDRLSECPGLIGAACDDVNTFCAENLACYGTCDCSNNSACPNGQECVDDTSNLLFTDKDGNNYYGKTCANAVF